MTLFLMMKVCDNVCLFQLYLLLKYIGTVESAKCSPQITLKDCNTKNEAADHWKWYTYKTYSITADVKKGCQSSNLEYVWTVLVKGGTKVMMKTTETSIYIKPYSLPIGTYLVKAEVTEISSDKQKAAETQTCTVQIHASEPIAIIAGGSIVTYAANEEVELNAGVSIDLDINPKGKTPTLFRYTWKCSGTHQEQKAFCNKKIPGKRRITIPKQCMVHNKPLKVTVFIENKQGGKSNTEQTLMPMEGHQKVEIRCIKNCKKEGSIRPSNTLSMSLMAVSKNVNTFKWEIKSPFNRLIYTVPSTSATLYLDPPTVKKYLGAGSTYKIVATIKDNTIKGYAEEHFQMDHVSGSSGKCTINPTSGISFETNFKIECINYHPGVQFFIYQKLEDSVKFGVLLSASTSPTTTIILAHTLKKIYIKTVSETGYISREPMIYVDVKSRIASIEQIGEKTKYIRRKYLLLKRLIHANLIDMSMQLICAIIESLKDLPKSLAPFRMSTNKDILTILDKLPLQGENEYQQLSSVLATLSTTQKDELDVAYQSKLSALCKKAAQFQLDQKANSRFKLIATEEVKDINQYLIKCAETAFKTPTVNETEEAKSENPLIQDKIFKENYPDYDQLKGTDGITQRLTSIADAIQTMHLSGQALSITNLVNEDTKLKVPENMDVMVKKKTVEDFNKEPLQAQGVELNMEVKTEDSNTESIQSVITTLDKKKNPFTFDATGNRIVTNIMDISVFTSENKKLKSFKKEVELTMDIISPYKPEPKNFTVDAPAHIKDWNGENMDYNMTVIRISAHKGGNLHLRIEPANPLQFIGTINRRPNFNDVQKGEIISEQYETVINPDVDLSKRDFWYYVGIIPAKKYAMDSMMKNENVSSTFSISAMTQKCSFWNWMDKEWDSTGCRIGLKNSKTKMNCLCEHLSMFVGIEDDLIAILHPILMIDNQLELQVDYIVFGFVVGMFIIFCVCIASSVGRRKLQLMEEETIFLSDNLKNERYAYLIVVETGSGASGTSSNIGIQIFGTKQYSKPHILNYPDPEKLLLQSRSLDFFVLTSEKHLGDILGVHIWTDAIGYRQAWYCNSIRIHDIQTAAIWCFNVKRWLTVLDNGKTQYHLVPNVTDKENVFRRILLRLCPFLKPKQKKSDAETSTKEVTLTYMEKSCINLSKVMMTGVVMLCCFGLPHFKMSDALYFGGHHFYSKVYWSIAAGAFAPFIAHIPVDIMFRYTKWRTTTPVKKRREKRLRLCLWVGLIFLIIFNMTFLLVCGFWISHDEARLWLLSTLVALLFTFFALETAYWWLKIYLGLQFEQIVEIKKEFGRIVQEAEAQRRILYNKFGEMLLRPYMKYKYFPLTKRKYLSKRRREMMRQEMKQMFQELIVFFFYYLVVFYLLLVHLDNQQVLSNKEMEDIVIFGNHLVQFSFDDFDSWRDVLMYVELTLLQSVHPIFWYDEWDKIDSGSMVDLTTKLLGVIQMRQLKVNRGACEVPEEVQFLNLTCEPEYSYKYDGDFSKEILDNHRNDERFPDFWVKKSASELNASSIWTNLASYPGSGFAMTFGRNKKNSEYILKYIDKYNWLDYFTRVLFINFWTYNPNHNIFNAIKLIVERSATGHLIPSYKIRTVRLLYTDVRKYVFAAICVSIFMLLMIRIIAFHIIHLIKQKLAYFKNFYNFLDVAILVLSAICFACHFVDSRKTRTLLKQLHDSKNNQFVPFDKVFTFRHWFTIFSAILICLCVLRIWKFLRFMRMFKIMEYTIYYAFKPLSAMMFCHFLIIMAFAFSGMIIFGANLDAFSTLRISLTNLFLMCMNLHSWEDFQAEMYDRISCYYYMIYMFITLVINTLYITLLMFYYTEGQEKYLSELRDPYNLVNYVWEESKYHGELFKVRFNKKRLKAGAEKNLPKVTPKSAELRYKDCETITISSLNYMNLIARGKVHTMQKHKEGIKEIDTSDIELMCKIGKAICDLELKKGKDHNIYYYPIVDEDKIEIVLDERLEQESAVVKKILKEDSVVTEKQEEKEPVTGSFKKRLDSIDDRLDYLSKVLKNITIVNHPHK